MQNIIYEKSGFCSRLILNREASCNALDTLLVSKILDVCESIKAEKNCKLLVIEAKGNTFCAGMDLKELVYFVENDYERLRNANLSIGRMFAELSMLDVVVVVLVDGNVYGGGLGFLAVADSVICSKGVVFSSGEVNLGLVPGQIYPFLERRMGGKLWNYLIKGSSFDVNRAYKDGLVDDVVDDIFLHCKYTWLTQCEEKIDSVIALKKLVRKPIEEKWFDSAADVFLQRAVFAYKSGKLSKFVH